MTRPDPTRPGERARLRAAVLDPLHASCPHRAATVAALDLPDRLPRHVLRDAAGRPETERAEAKPTALAEADVAGKFAAASGRREG